MTKDDYEALEMHYNILFKGLEKIRWTTLRGGNNDETYNHPHLNCTPAWHEYQTLRKAVISYRKYLDTCARHFKNTDEPMYDVPQIPKKTRKPPKKQPVTKIDPKTYEGKYGEDFFKDRKRPKVIPKNIKKPVLGVVEKQIIDYPKI